MNVLIRADSSSVIGTGHIMRDLVLAKQFRNDIVKFATQDLSGNINFKIMDESYPISTLKSNHWSELNELIQTLNINFLIIDHYGIDCYIENKLKEHNPKLALMVLDDTYKKHCCDILLNHNIYADKNKYKDLVPKDCELRCGGKYTLIRNEFCIEKKQQKIHGKTFTVFLALGGADNENISMEVMKVLSQFNVNIELVTTSANPHIEQLVSYKKNNSKLSLHINSNNIEKIMHSANLAIVAPSVILHEVLYMEIPFIAIKIAENQEYMYQYLLKEKYLGIQKNNIDGLKDLLTPLVKKDKE